MANCQGWTERDAPATWHENISIYWYLYISIMNLLRKKGRAWVDYPIYNSFKKYLGWGAWKDGLTDKGVWYAIPGTHLKVEREHQLHQCPPSPTVEHAWYTHHIERGRTEKGRGREREGWRGRENTSYTSVLWDPHGGMYCKFTSQREGREEGKKRGKVRGRGRERGTGGGRERERE